MTHEALILCTALLDQLIQQITRPLIVLRFYDPIGHRHLNKRPSHWAKIFGHVPYQKIQNRQGPAYLSWL